MDEANQDKPGVLLPNLLNTKLLLWFSLLSLV